MNQLVQGKRHQLLSYACRRVRISPSAPSYIHEIDVADLQLEPCCAIHFPNPNDLLHFKITSTSSPPCTYRIHFLVTPKEGFYRDGHFVFNYEIPENYPHAPPKVLCETRVCSIMSITTITTRCTILISTPTEMFASIF